LNVFGSVFETIRATMVELFTTQIVELITKLFGGLVG